MLLEEQGGEDRPALSLVEAVSEFLRHLRAHGRSADTRYAYGADLRRFGGALGHRPGGAAQVAEITRRDIEAYLCELAERGLAPKTRHRALCAIRAFFRFCHEAGLVAQNPAGMLSGVAVPKTLPSYLEVAEVELFLTRCHDSLARAIAATLFHTGIRVGELCSLRLLDVDFQRATLRVARGKGAKERIIPLSRQAKGHLLWYVGRLRPQLQKAAENSDSMFLGLRGRRLDRQWVGTLIRREARRQGWNRRVTPHTFRHSHATALYKAGVGLVTIAAILGHSDISTTQVYTHISSGDMVRAMEAIPQVAGTDREMG
jgi:site-specific recombinase XerD